MISWVPLSPPRFRSSRPLTRGPGRGLVVGGRPCMGADRGWPSLLAAFAAKMQQERVERFYAIQSHHT
ncbi:hypothetical protein GW17_00055260 [Ensete ventricosum]|nr:hypothetical protein GW17_00055260 [Ensete ventricosum]